MRFVAILGLMTLSALTLGCATAPKDPASLVETYRKFLLDTETPFLKRAKEHLRLQTETDPSTLPVNRFTQFGPSPGQALYFATVTLLVARPPLYAGMMTTTVDTSIVCVQHNDLAALGPIRSGMPITDHGPLHAHIRTPEYITLVTPRGPIDIRLIAFEKGCLSKIEHGVIVVPE